MSMKGRSHTLWSRLVWPVLWPLLLVQLVLVLLGFLVQSMTWLTLPQPGSWLQSTWLLLALLLGTSLVALAFLFQLHYRLSEHERECESRLIQVQQLLPTIEQQLPDWLKADLSNDPHGTTTFERLQRVHDRLVELDSHLAQLPRAERLLLPSRRPFLLLYQGRIVSANLAMQRLLGEKLEHLVGTTPEVRLAIGTAGSGQPNEMQIMGGRQRWHSLQAECLKAGAYQLLLCVPADTNDYSELLASRERAREDSRLKSRYLSLLQRELEPLLAELAQNMENADASTAKQHQLRERITDLRILLTSLAGEPDTPHGHTKPLRVLVVDDGPVSRLLASQLLASQGVRVDCVESGAEALERQRHQLRRQPYDLVLMDIFMPGMDGVETARHWRTHEARTYGAGRTTLVALTANATEHDRQRFARADMDDYLAKPYGPRQLVELVQRWHPDAFKEDIPR